MPRLSPASLLLLPIVLFVALASGCGKNSTEDAIQAPLEGREVSRAGQLTGTWMRVTPGDYLGFEFNREGQALVTHWLHGLQGETLTLKYSVQDGGRLNLVGPTGLTQVFNAVAAGDELELTPESGGRVGASQRFRRVSDGKPLGTALREHLAELETQRMSRLQALHRYLRTEGLVIRRAQDDGPGLVIAVVIEATEPSLMGRGIVDLNPERHDPLRPVQEVAVRGEIQPIGELDTALKIALQIEPLGRDRSAQGLVELEVTGDPERPSLRGRGHFPAAAQGAMDLVLVSDSSAHRRTEGRLAEHREVVRRAIAAVSDPFGGRVLLTGTRTAAGRAPQPVELLLEREGEGVTFRGVVTMEGREVPVTVAVDVVLGAGAVYVNQPSGEQWRLQRADADTPYRGPIRPNPQAEFLGHGEVEFTVSRMWTVAQVKAERDAIERFVSEEMRQPTVLYGSVARRRGADLEQWPVWMEIQLTDNDEVRGQIWLLGQNVGLEATGRRSEASFQMTTGKALADSTEARSLAQQRWQITLASMDPDPRFEGTMSSNLGGGGPVTLAPLSPAVTAQLRERLLEVVKAPAVRVTNLTISRRPEGSYFRFAPGDADHRYTGEVVGADLTGSNPSRLPPGLIQAELAETRGVPVLRLRVEGSPEPVRRRAGDVFEYTLAAAVSEKEPHLLGWGLPGVGNQTWLDLAIEAADALPEVSPEQTLRLAAHRAGAVIEAPQNPTPGQQVLLLIHATERDARLGHIHFANDRYSHGNSIPRAALHAGLLQPGETAMVRLSFDQPHTAPTVAVERHGITSTAGTFRPNNTVPTFRIERIEW